MSQPLPALTPVARLKAKIRARAKLWTMLYLLVLPCASALAIFTYFPNFETIKYAFYRWDGSQIEEYRGLYNFNRAFFEDPTFWHTFKLVGILLIANVLKMWPSIFVAIAIHRLTSERWQYLYRVLFVIPMVIPGMVFLLIWKTVFTEGLLNQFLNATGLMHVLRFLDSADHGLPALASLATRGGIGGWVPWILGGLSLAALIINHFGVRQRWLKQTALGSFALASLLILFTGIWTEPINAFATGEPAWLGNTKLIIPSVILWGLPWVGTIGVLIYLAGLQTISTDVYEAAELDGVGPWRKMFSIEIPLIMTQVRINLIFMTIGTLTDYGLFLILLGRNGGPGNMGMVPGLYMYQRAFTYGEFGYACALGLIMTVFVLALTLFYQKFVKVEK